MALALGTKTLEEFGIGFGGKNIHHSHRRGEIILISLLFFNVVDVFIILQLSFLYLRMILV
jgi:hypothetical protein